MSAYPPVRHYPSVTSTMDVAAEAMRAGAPHLTCITADEQRAGRGRQGKVWRTIPGHSLAATFVLRNVATSHLPLICSLTVLEALLSLKPGLPLGIKWPNDLLLMHQAATPCDPIAPDPDPIARQTNAKVAGMLIEATGGAEGQGALFGLGLNLSRPPEGEAVIGATLADSGLTATPEDVLAALFPCLDRNLALYATQGWAAFHDNYARHCITLGQPVVWKRDQDQELRGLALGLHDQTGALKLRTEDGTVHLIHSGDVVAQGRSHGS